MGFLQFRLECFDGLAGFVGELLVDVALLLGLFGQGLFLLGLLAQQLGNDGAVSTGGLRAAELALQGCYFFLQCVEFLTGVVRQLKWARFEVCVFAKGAVKPQCHFARDFEAFQGFAVANGSINLMGRFVATNSQQMEHLAYLRIHAGARLAWAAAAVCPAGCRRLWQSPQPANAAWPRS